MTPIPLPATRGLNIDDVQKWLWQANQGVGARRLMRGQRMAGIAGAAVVVVMEKGGCDRRTAEALIDELVSQGRARLEDVWIKGNQRAVVIAEPPPADVEDDETDAAF